MTEPRRATMKSPQAALLFALVLALVHTGWGDEEDPDLSTQLAPEKEETNEGTILSTPAAATTETFAIETNSTAVDTEEANQLEFILMVLIPLILLVLLLLSVILIGTYYKRKRTKKEPSSQGSQSALQTYELGSENVKVPIFEEDTPSVMEIEVEELDKWMSNMNRNADCECLPTLKEEKEPNNSPSFAVSRMSIQRRSQTPGN
ncbi:transmembrane protein 154 isoform X1 [Elephas maximus indicus]|uniref:transmembrane protein 154 isoform X1 n=1 Tax=Elephas maximus indicus TaxID=99487 RepID=UPI0021168822|nr:transmembrane protein 154 isoform X1 [Elephas maximus indicus]XP_049708723.1 transmembrane protein 154 isoform X1 [Elephas maximus indicus]